MVCRLVKGSGWTLDYIMDRTRPQIRRILGGLNEAKLIQALIQERLQKQSEDGDGTGSGAGSRPSGRAGRSQPGAYTTRYVKGKGNIMVCTGEPVTETKHSKKRSTLKINDPRALLSLPPTVDGAPVMKIIDRRRRKKRPKSDGQSGKKK